MLDNAGDQLIVEHADAARLDDYIGRWGLGEHGAQALDGRRIAHRASPRRWIHVAVLLPLVGVGLIESDLVSARCEVAQQAAIVSRGAVPPRRQQARSVK